MHLSSAAHLEELIIKHGMLERSDDEILGRDNRTAKRIKHDPLFFAGSSDPSSSTVMRVQFKPERDAEGRVVEDSFVVEESSRKRLAGQGVQIARLMLGRKLLMAERTQRLAN
eukprot:2393731-Pleurochrysis_carterae.AAC.1